MTDSRIALAAMSVMTLALRDYDARELSKLLASAPAPTHKRKGRSQKVGQIPGRFKRRKR